MLPKHVLRLDRIAAKEGCAGKYTYALNTCVLVSGIVMGVRSSRQLESAGERQILWWRAVLRQAVEKAW